jgi:hypothetical protein
MVYDLFASPIVIIRFSISAADNENSGVRKSGFARRMMGEGKVERSKIRIMAIDRTLTSETDGARRDAYGLPLPELSTARGRRKREVLPHPSVRPGETILPSRPAQPPAGARRAAVKDGPTSGRRLRRRAASLTAASTTAASCAVGASPQDRSKPHRHQVASQASQTLYSEREAVAELRGTVKKRDKRLHQKACSCSS